MYRKICFSDECISSYNVFLGIGIIAFFLLVEKVCKREAIGYVKMEQLYIMLLSSSIIGVLGATSMEAFYHSSVANLQFAGFTFYGGLIGGILALWAISLFLKQDFITNINLLVAPFVISHAFGRIGCFLGGCCYGLPTSSVWGIRYPTGSLPHCQYPEMAIFPVQLFEAFFLFALYTMLRRTKQKFATYLLVYPVFRFFIEFLRGDPRGTLFTSFLSPSQEISIVLFVFGLALIVKTHKVNVTDQLICTKINQ